MSTPALSLPEARILNIRQEIQVKDSLETTFAALLEQLGPGFTNMEGTPMPLKIEAHPGGRWYRDLGRENGHFWGSVQAIKRPTLLEFCVPLMLSFPAVHNVQYRLTESNGGTLIKFQHLAAGPIPAEKEDGMPKGWDHILTEVRKRAEKR